MGPRHAVLLTPSKSSGLNELFSCKQSASLSPQIAFFVFKRLRTLSFSVCRKSFARRSYENNRGVYQLSPFWYSPLASRHLPVAAAPSCFVFIFFRTLLHSFALFCSSRRSNTLVFKRFRTLCEKHPGGGRSPTLVCPVCPELRRDRFLRREQSSTLQQETSAPFVLFPYNPPGCGKLVHK